MASVRVGVLEGLKSPILHRDNLLEEKFWIISDKNLTITFVYFIALARSLFKRSIIFK